jgi:hypothetical protein
MIEIEKYSNDPRQIETAISWLHKVKQDCDHSISRLETMRAYHERQARYKQNLNDLADEFDNEDFEKHSTAVKLNIIIQRVGVGTGRAEKILDLLHARIKKRRLKRRNAQIVDNYLNGYDNTKNARLSGVSRQTVHSVLTAEKCRKLL